MTCNNVYFECPTNAFFPPDVGFALLLRSLMATLPIYVRGYTYTMHMHMHMCVCDYATPLHTVVISIIAHMWLYSLPMYICIPSPGLSP